MPGNHGGARHGSGRKRKVNSNSAEDGDGDLNELKSHKVYCNLRLHVIEFSLTISSENSEL